MLICFPSIVPIVCVWGGGGGGITSGSELLLHPFPLIRAIRAARIFVLEFSNNGFADLLEEFADGGFDNQPVIQQVGVSLSSGQVSQHYFQVQSNSNGFLILVTD